MNKETFKKILEEKGIPLNDYQLNQFHIYYRTLVEWNEKMNLTAITSEEDVYLKHFYDSITAAFHYDFSHTIHVCDVGAGAGFPSIPIKICFPAINVTIVDSLKKRITFLEHLSSELGLTDINVYHDRAEVFGKNPSFREQFDVVIARAVARMAVLSELCLPLAKVGGKMIAMKGSNFHNEMKQADQAIEKLGGEIHSINTFYLPEENSERNIAIIQKVKATPKKFPRKPGVPGKNPLI